MSQRMENLDSGFRGLISAIQVSKVVQSSMQDLVCPNPQHVGLLVWSLLSRGFSEPLLLSNYELLTDEAGSPMISKCFF